MAALKNHGSTAEAMANSSVTQQLNCSDLHWHYPHTALAGLLHRRAVPRNCAGAREACTLLSVAVQMSTVRAIWRALAKLRSFPEALLP